MSFFLEVLGVGNAFTPNITGTSFLIQTDDEDILVDCGFGVFGKLIDKGYNFKNLKGILITHIHEDHISQLASLLCYIKYELKHHELPYIITKNDNILKKYLYDICKIKFHVPTTILGENDFINMDYTMFDVKHTDNSVGFVIKNNRYDKVFIITGDTKCDINIYNIWNKYKKSYTTIFHDCQVHNIRPPNSLITPHATINEIILSYPKEMLDNLFGVHYGFKPRKEVSINLAEEGMVF